jgi:hypothetical protein
MAWSLGEGIGVVDRGRALVRIEGWERGRSSILVRCACAEWKVAASEVAEILDMDRLCQWVLRGERWCFGTLDGVTILSPDSAKCCDIYGDVDFGNWYPVVENISES